MNNIKVKFVDLPLQLESQKSEIVSKIVSVMESGDYILGSEVKEFEKKFAKYCDCKYAVGIANGTDALFLSMKALGIGNDDEVITAPNSFISTAGAIIAAGAKPVFVDVDEDYNINPELIEKVITKKTKAIIPVHLAGRPANMKPILGIAGKHDLYVIEDAAQAVGSKYKGGKTGSFGVAGCFSLHPLKNLNCCGDGGAITTNNKELFEKLILLRNHGLKNRDECEVWGYNSRLDSMQAAILNVRLGYLEKTKIRINEIVSMYREGLKDIVDAPIDKKHEEPFYHNFIIKVDRRDELQKCLLEKGIQTSIHYPIPIHLQKSAKDLEYNEGDFPVVESQAKRILSLPLYAELSNEQIMAVINTLKSFYNP
jgi:dTDP-4-amino-4,6-dideoxygalactose transaminase